MNRVSNRLLQTVGHSCLLCCVAAGIVLTSTMASHATTRNWIVGSGNWSNNGNWDPFGAPVAGNDAKISFSDGIGRTITYDYAGPTVTLNDMTLDLSGSLAQSASLSMSGNNLYANYEFIGVYGRGAVTQSGGTNSAYYSVWIGDGLNGGSGNYTLTNNANLVTGTLAMNRGTLTIADQAKVATNILLDVTGDPSTAVNINGGTLSIKYGYSTPRDILNFNSGTVILGGERTIGSDDDILLHLEIGGSIGPGKSLEFENLNLERDFTVDGTTLKVSNQFLFDRTSVAGDLASTLTVKNGGQVQAGDLALGRVGGLEQDDYPSKDKVVVTGEGSRLSAFVMTIGNSMGDFAPHTDDNSVTISNHGRVETVFLGMKPHGKLVLMGGTLKLEDYTESFGGGIIDFQSGTVEYDNIVPIDGATPVISKFFGSLPTITTGKEMRINLGSPEFRSLVILDGGTFTASALDNGTLLELRRGTLRVTEQALNIGVGGAFPSLDVNENLVVDASLGIVNQGLVTGDGRIDGSFYNADGGELRAQVGRSLMLTGAGNTNAGQIKILDGELRFTQGLTNNAGAIISGNGSLITEGGLANLGTMNFAGTANIIGQVTNAPGGKIVSGGGGATIFYDNVVNNGEIRTSTNGFTVFFGSVSGAGSFTGTGTVNFEGPVSPGNSPAVVNFGGDVVLGADSTLHIELGGLAAGTGYDRINVTGDLVLDGTLEIALINGFTPTAGQSFDFLNATSVTGAFASVILPGGYTWDVTQLASGIVLVSSVVLPGDFNHDGKVDAADYVVWRKTGGSQADYNTWRANFGLPNLPGSGASVGPNSAVPEPATMLLVAVGNAAVALMSARQRRAFSA